MVDPNGSPLPAQPEPLLEVRDLQAWGGPDDAQDWYARNFALLALPFLAAFLAWKRALPARGWVGGGAAFVAAALVMNLGEGDRG